MGQLSELTSGMFNAKPDKSAKTEWDGVAATVAYHVSRLGGPMVHRGRRKSTKGKVIRRALLCLVLGAAMTVAVAWGCALFVTPSWIGEDARTDGPYYEQYRPDVWPPLDYLFSSQGVGVTKWDAVGIVVGEHDTEHYMGSLDTRPKVAYFIFEHQYGLIVRTMSRFSSLISGNSDMMSDPELQSHRTPDFPPFAFGQGVPSWFPSRFHGRTLPLLPLWPAFAFSTLLYAVMIWPVLSLPGVLRHRHRLRLGLCLHCKYPVGDFAVCPECGGSRHAPCPPASLPPAPSPPGRGLG